MINYIKKMIITTKINNQNIRLTIETDNFKMKETIKEENKDLINLVTYVLKNYKGDL